MTFVYFLFIANKCMWGGFGCVNEVISTRGWKIDVCVWCCCRFVWNELSGGRLAAVPTHDATDRKSVCLWTRAFHGSLADPSFCLLFLWCLSLFWKLFFGSVPSEILATAVASSDHNLLYFLHQYKITSPLFPFFSFKMSQREKGFFLPRVTLNS